MNDKNYIKASSILQDIRYIDGAIEYINSKGNNKEIRTPIYCFQSKEERNSGLDNSNVALTNTAFKYDFSKEEDRNLYKKEFIEYLLNIKEDLENKFKKL